jgi:hypothetical protein
MNLNYYTLWVENDPEWLETTLENISEIVSEHGFVLISEKCLSAEDFYAKTAENSLFLNKFDLILTDFNLGAGDDGNVLIKKIRENKGNPYTDIIFYGQDQEAISQILNDNFIEGVYRAPRDLALFSEKFEKIFESTIKKVQDISMMRGLVISEASDMAMRILTLIENYLNKISDEETTKLHDYILTKIIGQHQKNNEKFLEKIQTISIHELIKDRFFDDSKKLRILSKIFTNHEIADFKFQEEYMQDIIDIRNELGHCIESEKDGNRILSTHRGEKTFTHEECVEIRKRIINHHIRLDIIEDYIASMPSSRMK